MRRVLLLTLALVACKDEKQPDSDTPYPDCEGLDNGVPCGKNGLCTETPGGTVCSPKCEDNSDCPAFDGVTVMCSGLCELVCKAPSDCPDGMICDDGATCAWPKD